MATKSALLLRRHLLAEEDGEGEELNAEAASAFGVLLLFIILLVCLLQAYVLRRLKPTYLHESAGAIMVGLLGGVAIYFMATAKRVSATVAFDQQFFLFFLLPPIIFEAGFNMKKKAFFRNIDSIAIYAVAGTLISAFVFASGLYAAVLWLPRFAVAGGGDSLPNLTFLECLIFGSLISATDPVTVLAIFKDMRVDIDLYSNVFGESVLNDAVALVLLETVLGFHYKDVTVRNVALAAVDFVWVFAGSVVIGLAVALLCTMLFRFAEFDEHPVLETAMLILFAYISYMLAQSLYFSGIVSILFCGLGLAQYCSHNMSRAAKTLTSEVFEVVAFLSETFIFAYLGLAIMSFSHPPVYVMVALSIVLCQLSRAVITFGLSAVINFYRRHYNMPTGEIPLTHQVMSWWSGLRGGMAFALSLSIPTAHGDSILTSTLFTALFTVLVFGGAAKRLVDLLGIPCGEAAQMPRPDVDRALFFNSPWQRFQSRYLTPVLVRTKSQAAIGEENPAAAHHASSHHAH